MAAQITPIYFPGPAEEYRPFMGIDSNRNLGLGYMSGSDMLFSPHNHGSNGDPKLIQGWRAANLLHMLPRAQENLRICYSLVGRTTRAQTGAPDIVSRALREQGLDFPALYHRLLSQFPSDPDFQSMIAALREKRIIYMTDELKAEQEIIRNQDLKRRAGELLELTRVSFGEYEIGRAKER